MRGPRAAPLMCRAIRWGVIEGFPRSTGGRSRAGGRRARCVGGADPARWRRPRRSPRFPDARASCSVGGRSTMADAPSAPSPSSSSTPGAGAGGSGSGRKAYCGPGGWALSRSRTSRLVIFSTFVVPTRSGRHHRSSPVRRSQAARAVTGPLMRPFPGHLRTALERFAGGGPGGGAGFRSSPPAMSERDHSTRYTRAVCFSSFTRSGSPPINAPPRSAVARSGCRWHTSPAVTSAPGRSALRDIAQVTMRTPQAVPTRPAPP